MRKIFISQGTLNYSRNRNQRKLEAKMDTLEGKCSKDKPLFYTLQNLPEKLIFECPHYNYCRIKDFGRINCLTKDTIETCQTYKFYKKYKDFDYGRQLGI